MTIYHQIIYLTWLLIFAGVLIAAYGTWKRWSTRKGTKVFIPIGIIYVLIVLVSLGITYHLQWWYYLISLVLVVFYIVGSILWIRALTTIQEAVYGNKDTSKIERITRPILVVVLLVFAILMIMSLVLNWPPQLYGLK